MFVRCLYQLNRNNDWAFLCEPFCFFCMSCHCIVGLWFCPTNGFFFSPTAAHCVDLPPPQHLGPKGTTKNGTEHDAMRCVCVWGGVRIRKNCTFALFFCQQKCPSSGEKSPFAKKTLYFYFETGLYIYF